MPAKGWVRDLAMTAPVNAAKLDAIGPDLEPACDECLSDEDVLAFANGTLDSSRHLEAHLHLDQCEVCQRLLSEAAHALATAVTDPIVEVGELSWHTTFQPGTLVGQRYLIRHFIARGGMGEVYEAFDRELQERVALKTVTATACDNPGAVRRLKAEVQLARRVSHPNVCRIYDFGMHVMPETGAQISFLTMEFVDGETLGQRVRLSGALPVHEARAIGRELLEGLCAAHEAGVLHRDFKSDNVMLRDEPDGSRSPLILDFGLARALDEGSRNNSSSTPNLLGTFSYIAPEQLQGRPHTTASDVYSLGLVWFEMLTGELPFASPSSPVGSALARLKGDPAAPSSKNPLVPSDLDAVVLRCLRRLPKDRYKTAREVLNGLDAAEARAHRAPMKRALNPLCIGALLGGLAAYVSTIPTKHPPVVAATVHASQAAPPVALRPSDATSDSTPTPQPAQAAPPPSAAQPDKPSDGQANRGGAQRPKPTSRTPAPPTNTPAPPTNTPAPIPTETKPAQEPTPSEPLPKKPPVWEDPFGVSTTARATVDRP